VDNPCKPAELRAEMQGVPLAASPEGQTGGGAAKLRCAMLPHPIKRC